MINDKDKFYLVPYFLTQFGLMIIFFFLLFFGAFKEDKLKVGEIASNSNNVSWDSDIDPIMLMQLTDTHLNYKAKKQTKAKQLQIALNQSTAIYNPSLIFISGDLVDNKDPAKNDIGYGNQHVKDYILYQSVLDSIQNFDKTKLIDIAGNHDEYGVGDLNSQHHNVMNYSIYFSNLFQESRNLQKFWISRKETEEVEIFSINPYWHPVPHAKLAFNIFPTTPFLDELEKNLLLEFEKSDKPRIVQCHFPLNLWIGTNLVKTSSTKKTIFDILKSANISIFLTGHWHPFNKIISHHEGFLEIVCSDLTTHRRFGLITIDNNHLSFHDATIDSPLRFIVTHPIPIEQLSSQSVFNDKNTEVRVLVFTRRTDLKITATFTSNECACILNKVKLNYIRETKNGAMLYSAPIPSNLSYNCKYHLSLSGDLFKNRNISVDESNEKEFDFVIGDSVFLPPENNFFRPSWKIIIYVTLAFLWFFLFVITFPFTNITKKFNSKLKVTELNEWIFGNEINSCTTFKYIRNLIKSIFLGPFAMNERINNCSLPLSLRIYLFCIVLYPLFMPVSFILVEKYLGIIWTYGYILKGKATIDLWGVKYSCLFVSVFLMPVVLFCSTYSSVFPAYLISSNSNFPLKSKINKCILISVFDLLLILVGIGGTFFLGYYFLIEAVGWILSLLSPMFVLIPVLTFIWLLVYVVKLIKNKGQVRQKIEDTLDRQKLIYSQM